MLIASIAAIVILTTATACTHLITGRSGGRPAADEFGTGPRPSAQQLYTAGLEPSQPLRVRELQTIRVSIRDAAGHPVDGAAVTVDSGMPEHGHGLPTRPRARKGAGEGMYDIEGVRFNMGGWWELTLTIHAAAGTDSVTFNLDL